MMKYADVIIPLAVEGMYTYAIPKELEGVIEEGTLVWLAFAGNKKYTALVAKIHFQKPESYDVRDIEGIADEQIRFSEQHLKFIFWVSSYYMATLGEVLKASLPIMFRLESYTLMTRTEEEIDDRVLTNSERILLNFLRPGEYVSLKEAEKYLKLKNGMHLLKGLLTKKYIQVKETIDELFREKTVSVVTLVQDFSEDEYGYLLESLKKAPLQYRTLCRWIELGKKEWEKTTLLKEIGVSSSVLKGLCEKRIFKIEKRPLSVNIPMEWKGILNPLTEEQKKALEEIQIAFKKKDCVLLQGVTSSGKTELYIHLINQIIEQGQQVLYMLPEIALTVQIVQRLKRAFGDSIGIYHSGMSDYMRAELWRKQCSTTPYRLILGVRSSIFLPFVSLGLIIIDEEHDTSYKQKDPAPRYQGRDAAIMLGKMYGARILLGSATPSFESYQNAISGKYGFVKLLGRYGGVQMPELSLLHVGEYRRKKMMSEHLSPPLIQEMQKVLLERKQVILFQNRRGYSSYVQCGVCGGIPKCRHCDVSLTYYKQKHILMCRYCGSIVSKYDLCPDCGGQLKEKIPGTERIEEEVNRLFPQYRIARMDLDVVGSKNRFRRVMEEFEQGEIDVLIGTQMISKGLDFGNVKLVGVIDADSMLHFPDFRSEERAYCMLLQVSGRCGRRGERGKVMIQTNDIKNRVYTLLLQNDYAAFFDQLMIERQLFVYPPAGRMIWIEMRYKDVVVLRHAANYLVNRLREKLECRICGPAVPEVSRIRRQYRLMILVKIDPFVSCSKIKTLLKQELMVLRKDKTWNGIRIFCDVDP